MATVSEMFPARPRKKRVTKQDAALNKDDYNYIWLCAACAERRRDLQNRGQIWGFPSRPCQGCGGFNGILRGYEVVKIQEKQKSI